MSTTIVIPEGVYIGYIIGRGGWTIRSIEEKTKTKIQWPHKWNPSDRKFMIYGSGWDAVADVDRAVDEILELVNGRLAAMELPLLEKKELMWSLERDGATERRAAPVAQQKVSLKVWSELSASAIGQILTFLEDNRWPRCDDDQWSRYLRELRPDELAENGHRFLKRRRVLLNALKEKDVQGVFAHGKPLVIDEEDLRRLIVPKIVEAFQLMTKEPSFLDITVAVPKKEVKRWYTNQMVDRTEHPTEVWPQVYDTYLPCDVCTTVETSTTWRVKDDDPPDPSTQWPPLPQITSVQYAVEKFHIPSKHFAKQLAVELHFALGDPEKRTYGDTPIRSPTVPREEKIGLHRVAIRLVDGDCRNRPHAVARRSNTALLISDFALDVYGFVDRANVGTSLVANRSLNEQIIKLQHLLPVHHLVCEFEEIPTRYGSEDPPAEYYWLILHHFRRGLTYSDVRRFKLLSTATAADCALIVRYLSNSHVADFKAPGDQVRFSVPMLAALVDRNFSMGRLRLRVLDGPLTDYRSVDTIFGGGLRLGALYLRIHEGCLVRLMKTSDFMHMPVVQRLTELKIQLEVPTPASSAPLQRDVISSQRWPAGVHLLRNCAFYRVDWQWSALTDYDSPSVQSMRHLESFVFNLVQICEKFERGELSETVAHSVFCFPPRVPFPFKDSNKIASGVKVETEEPFSTVDNFTWDVYRFRNVVTGKWLTASVGHTDLLGSGSALHIVKGEVYPNVSYGIVF